MNSWLPYLVEELEAGRPAILIISERGNLARAAVVNPQGQALAGDGSVGEGLAWGKYLTNLGPGEALALPMEGDNLVLEIVTPASLSFWVKALSSQKQAWAAWLLTMSQTTGNGTTVHRHLLAAEGPWTTPRLPQETRGNWSLLPLNAGLGALLVFGDDDLALETAALGARVGLRVNLVTKRPEEQALAARSLGEFNWRGLAAWSEVTPEILPEIGLKPGVFVLVTTKDHQSFLPAIEAAPTGWLGLAGAAAVKGESGLFPEAITPAQKALGILAAMLE
jgi:hypothetical protein